MLASQFHIYLLWGDYENQWIVCSSKLYHITPVPCVLSQDSPVAPLYLHTAPLLMMRPSSALQRPQLLAGSAAHWAAPPGAWLALTPPRRRSALSSARSRLKIDNWSELK